MKKTLLISLVISIALVGCGQQVAPATQSQTSPPAECPASSDPIVVDNSKVADLMGGKLDNKAVQVTGTVCVYDTNDMGDQKLTIVEIYPNPDDQKQLVVAYFNSPIDTPLQVGDNVIIKGVCTGKKEVDGMDYNAIGLLADSIEVIPVG